MIIFSTFSEVVKSRNCICEVETAIWYHRCADFVGSVWKPTRFFSRWPHKWSKRPIGVAISRSGSVSNQANSFSDDPKSHQSVPEALRICVRVHFQNNPKAVPMTRKVTKASQKRCEIAFGFTFTSTRKPFKRPGKGLNCVGRPALLLPGWLSPQSESSMDPPNSLDPGLRGPWLKTPLLVFPFTSISESLSQQFEKTA